METKPFWQSETFWGTLLAVAAPLAMKYGFDVTGMATEIVAVIGGIVAIHGRWRARTKLSVV